MHHFFVPMFFKRSEHVQPEDFVVPFWLEMLCLYLAWSTVFLDDTFLYSGIANRKLIVAIGIASLAKSDLASYGVPLG